MTKIAMWPYGTTMPSKQWYKEMETMLRAYVRGEPQYVELDKSYDARREGSIGRIHITDKEMQNILHGGPPRPYWYNGSGETRETIEVKEENILASKLESYHSISFKVRWDGRRNELNPYSGYGCHWLKGRTAEEGTLWKWDKPEKPKVVAKDRLDREINKGDFISYVLYHFDNGGNAAGIYYGKVTKVEEDGTVWAKNIKLRDDDSVADLRIKDNSLIVIMSKDLMDKLMLARLSTL